MSHLKVVHCKRKSKRDKAKTEEHNITEEYDDHETVQNPSQAHTIPLAAEQPIVTEGNTAYGMIQTTSLVQLENVPNQPVYTEEANYASLIELKTVEQPIATKENTAYGITQEINSAAQGVDQQNNRQSEAAADEAVYEVIPTNSDTKEFNAVQNTSPDGMEGEHIATEGNIAYGTVEQPIATEKNTAYGITQEINSAAQGVDQQNNGQSEAAADETVYEAIPTNSDTEEFNAVQNTSPDGMQDEHIATEGNIAYGMARDISSSAQPLTASLIDQHQQHSTAGNEAVYQVIPTKNDTEESPTLGMVHNTTSDNALEHSITTEGNISYGIARWLDSSKLTTSFDQHKTQKKQSSTGEGDYEAIPTGNANDESTYDYPKFSSEDAHDNPPQPPGDTSLPLQQQMDITNVKQDPYYI